MKEKFKCTKCNQTFPKWHGRCPGCSEYNCLEEFVEQPVSTKKGTAFSENYRPGAKRSLTTLQPEDLSTNVKAEVRASTHVSEFDRALGGGVVAGSVTLIGGAPGIGKSTLLMQAAANMSRDRRVVYISGEESKHQVSMRAKRIGADKSNVGFIATRDCLAVADLIETLPAGSMVIIDSIQTMDAGLESAPGSTAQMQACANQLIPAAKNTDVALLIVNQVTKEGSFAGPNLLKHAVDTALMIEQDNSSGAYRIMRAEKNRFGQTDEVGIFSMTSSGMESIDNPSEVFISQRDATTFGSVIFPSIEGTRPLLLEVQALVSPTTFSTGRRSATGWDTNRLNMLIAVMSTRLGINLGASDIYLNIAGGMKVSDPAIDFAVVAALLSAYTQEPLPADMLAFGEVGLSGEVRFASRSEARVKEGHNLGFRNILCPVDKALSKKYPSCKGIDRISRLFIEFPNLKTSRAA